MASEHMFNGGWRVQTEIDLTVYDSCVGPQGSVVCELNESQYPTRISSKKLSKNMYSHKCLKLGFKVCLKNKRMWMLPFTRKGGGKYKTLNVF